MFCSLCVKADLKGNSCLSVDFLTFFLGGGKVVGVSPFLLLLSFPSCPWDQFPPPPPLLPFSMVAKSSLLVPNSEILARLETLWHFICIIEKQKMPWMWSFGTFFELPYLRIGTFFGPNLAIFSFWKDLSSLLLFFSSSLTSYLFLSRFVVRILPPPPHCSMWECGDTGGEKVDDTISPFFFCTWYSAENPCLPNQLFDKFILVKISIFLPKFEVFFAPNARFLNYFLLFV